MAGRFFLTLAVVGAGLVCAPRIADAQGAPEAAPAEALRFVVFQQKTDDATAPEARCLAGFVRRSHPLYIRHRLLVLEYNSDGPPDTNRLATCLGDAWLQVPLERAPGMVRVPTDEILVQFKAAAQSEDIEALLKANNLTMEMEHKGPFHLITARTHRPSVESQAIAGKLLLSGLVENAETNKVLIRFEQ